MRICIVSHLYPISRDDYKGIFVHEIATALRARGHEVHIVTPRRPGGAAFESHEGITVHRFRHWGWWRGRQLGQLRGTPPLILSTLMIAGLWTSLRVVLRYRPDLMSAYWVVPGGFLAWLTARLTGRPVVVTAGGTDLNVSARKWMYRPFVLRTVRGVDRLIACGSELHRVAISLGAAPERTVNMPSLVPDAVPELAVAPPEGAPGRRLLYVGNLAAPKRVDTLLRAMARLVPRFPDARLTLVGDGPLEPSLRALAQKLGVAECVDFRGRRPHEEIPGLMRSADVLLHCSENEGLPVAIQEALTCGLPVIAARVGGVPDLVRDGTNGRLCAPDDDAAFAEAMAELVGDAALRERMSAAARQFAAEHLDRTSVIARIEAVYREAIENRSRQRA